MDEERLSEHEVTDIDKMEKIGYMTPFTCPECGGVMWSVRNAPVPRFICHTGHSFTAQAYISEQSRVIENSLWSVVRFMQERIKVLQKLAENDREEGRTRSAGGYESKLRELKHHTEVIHNLIVSGKGEERGPGGLK